LIAALVDTGELDPAADLIRETWDIAEASGDAVLKERVSPLRSKLSEVHDQKVL
jgi:hypothetical protein